MRSLAALAFAASFAFCVAGAADLHRGNQSEPDTLDPSKSTGSWESNIIGDMFVGLTTEDAAANPIPGAAESWTTSPDGLTWTFKMRQGAVWSDGEPVTARDFVYSFRRELDPATASQYASLLYVLAGAEDVNGGKAPPETLGVSAPDDMTLVLKLTHPASYLPQLMMHQITYPVPEHVISKFGKDWVKPGNYVSNGPFKLTEWVPNDHVKAEKNNRFYDAADVKLDAVYYYPTDDAEAALKRFRTGELDLNVGFPAQAIDQLRKEMPETLETSTLINVRYIVMNTERKPFNDVRVRQAISLAINREVIASQILRAGEQPAYSIVPPGTAGYENGPRLSFEKWPMDKRLSDARQLLQEAGYGPDNPLSFTYSYISDNDSRRMAAALQSMWKAIGIDVQVSAGEKKTHYNNVRARQYEVAEANWFGDYNDATNFLFLAQPSAGDMNMSRYANPDYEALIRKSDQEVDAAQRAATMKEAEAMMLEEAPMTPVFFGVSRNLVHPWVKGWEPNLINTHRSRWMSIEAKPGANGSEAMAGAPNNTAGVAQDQDRPWYWWIVAIWDWLKGLMCAWFGILCPAG